MRGMRPIRTADDEELTRQRRSGWRTIRRVSPYLWPKEPELAWVRGRVIWSMVILVLAKLITVATPAFYKWAVDALNPQTPVEYLGLGAVGLTVAYGMARMLSNGFQQLRDAVFAAVGQRALRMLALETFQHIHRLSMRYHLTRKTGGLSRIIERGVKGVDFLLRFLLFLNNVPQVLVNQNYKNLMSLHLLYLLTESNDGLVLPLPMMGSFGFHPFHQFNR